MIIVLLFGVLVMAQTLPQTGVEKPAVVANGSTATNQSNSTQNITPGSVIQTELLVRFEQAAFPSATALEVTAMQAHAEIGAVRVIDYTPQGLDGLQLVRLPPGMTVEQGIAYYKGLPTVRYAEANAVYSIANNSSAVPITPSISRGNTSSTGQLFVRYNATSFTSPQDMKVYSNTTATRIGAGILTDYTMYGLPGLQLLSLPVNMTLDSGLAYFRSVAHVLYAEPNVRYAAINNSSTVNRTVHQTSPGPAKIPILKMT